MLNKSKLTPRKGQIFFAPIEAGKFFFDQCICKKLLIYLGLVYTLFTLKQISLKDIAYRLGSVCDMYRFGAESYPCVNLLLVSTVCIKKIRGYTPLSFQDLHNLSI